MLPGLRDHRLAETTLTIALAYLVFVIAQRYPLRFPASSR